MIVNGGSGKDCHKIIAYDPSNGQELWHAGETTELVAPTPWFAMERFLVPVDAMARSLLFGLAAQAM